MKGYGYFKCLDCGKGFRVFSAGLSRDNLQNMFCHCGSKRVVNIPYKEYKELPGKFSKHKPVKRKHKTPSRYIPQFDLDDFLKELEKDVSAVTEEHAEAEQKEELDGRKKKRKKRKKGNSGQSRWDVIA